MSEKSPTDSESFYRVLVENASEGMLTIDTESRIIYANPAIEEILGYTPSELVGSSKMDIIPERLRSDHSSVPSFDSFSQIPRVLPQRGLLATLVAITL